MKNGDKIKITYLPPCINGAGERNPYIGMQGEVRDLTGKMFNLLTETSWLVGIHIRTCRFKYL